MTLEIAHKYGAGYLHASTSDATAIPCSILSRKLIGAMSIQWAPAQSMTKRSVSPKL